MKRNTVNNTSKSSNSRNNESFKICSLNCHGFKSIIPYISSLLSSNDILFLSEHWLSDSETFLMHNITRDHLMIFHPVQKRQQGRPFGGNSFLIRKTKFEQVDIIHEDDHILCIKLIKNNKTFIIAGVYLESCHNNNQSVDLYQTQLNTLNGITKSFIDEGEIITLGDF